MYIYIYTTAPIVNSALPNAAYMRQWVLSALVQITACRRISDKPLSKPMLWYCQLDPQEKNQWNFNQNKEKNHEYAFQNTACKMAAFCPGGDELIGVYILQFSEQFCST